MRIWMIVLLLGQARTGLQHARPLLLAAGDWFCSQECTTINQLLGSYIQAGQMEIADSPLHTWQVGLDTFAGVVVGLGLAAAHIVGLLCSR